MITLILGGSGSGKSAYAEEYIGKLPQGKKKYYLAAMQALNEEGLQIIERHRILRKGKGFETIEQPVSIEDALQKMEAGEKYALLECITNLTANEMFQTDVPKDKETVVSKIMKGIVLLHQEVSHLVIVADHVFGDGVLYDETTMEYIQALGSICEKIASMAEQVVEVVVGIPIVIRGGNRN